MYYQLFDSYLEYFLTSLALIIFSGLLTKNLWLGFRLFFFAFGPFFAVAFYIVGVLNSNSTTVGISIYLLVFELSIFVALVLLLKKFMNRERLKSREDLDSKYAKIFWRLFIMKLAILVYLSRQQGFGIFSQGSRIDYLNDSSINLWLTYLGIFVSIFMTGLLLNRSFKTKKLDRYFVIFLVLLAAETLIGGSKGAVIMWLLGFLSLYVRLERKKLHAVAIFILPIGVFSVVVIANIIKNMGLSTYEFTNLIIGRFFLVNDGRALSIDLHSSNTGLAHFLRNSFRSIANLLGTPPTDPAIGNVLYQNGLGNFGGGANGSFGALAAFYLASDFWALALVVLMSFILTVLTVILFLKINSYYRGGVLDGIGFLLGFKLLALMSQDFLAFQVMGYFVVLLVMGIFIKEMMKYRISKGASISVVNNPAID